MYKAISNSITNMLIKKNLIPIENKEIYLYGFEIITSSIVYALIFLISALITSTLLSSLVFFVGFYFIRKFCGGFHADTYLKCHIMTAVTHYLAILLILFFPKTLLLSFSSTSLYCCSLLIFMFAPVDHKNKRFIKNEYRNFKVKACSYACIIIVLITIYLLNKTNLESFNIYLFAFSIGTLSATISMLSAKIINLYERRNIK